MVRLSGPGPVDACTAIELIAKDVLASPDPDNEE
jgi:hypothetical protein